ncbi:hypothetical protein [Nocardioides sp.]|uniref:hypothetical protein n=1 Tax=Nocardioides sp. TaxID=35761 RepID=UPI002ED53630
MNRIAVAGLVAGAVALVIVPVAVIATDPFGPQTTPDPAAPSEPDGAPTRSVGPSAPGPSTSPADPFTPAAYDAWAATIPDNLAIAEGLPADGGDFERSHQAVIEPFCGRDGDVFPVDGVLDAMHDGAAGPEFADRRSLRLYADDAAAHSLLVAAREAAHTCAREEHGDTLWLIEVADADLGEEALRVVRTYETDGLPTLGATFWHLVRVGNAVLVTARSGEYLPGETLGQGIASHARTIAPIIDAMCGFSAVGCAVASDIPDSFPLAAGWPDDDAAEPGPQHGLRGPNRSLEPLTWDMCGASFTPTGARDRLRADWNNVEDHRARELITFEDAEAAVVFTGSLLSFWRDCPRQEHDDGYASVNTVRPTGVGGESWALLRWSEYDGSPGVGLTLVHVTRLGRAVLIDQASNEGSRDFADEQVDAQIVESAAVVSAMCGFTEAGC